MNKTINIICFKTGDKYGNEYVHKLHDGLQRNLTCKTIKYNFYCATDNPNDINSDISTIKISKDLGGWWNKMMVFGNNPFDLQSDYILVLDLDVIITDGLDNMIEWGINQNAKLVIIDDWWQTPKYNSSVFLLKTNALTELWIDFIEDIDNIKKKNIGDQDWISRITATTWPKEWILSYKQSKIIDVIPNNCKIVVFHGKPKPHELEFEWIKENWK